MSAAFECLREQDVLDALASARWPARCADDLRAHVAGCAVCRDVVEVVGPLLELADETWPEVCVPAPGTVWWRAQLRARREAARQASRPIGIVQAVAGTAAIVLVAAVLWVTAPWLSGWAAGVEPPSLATLNLSWPELPSLSLPDVSAFARWWWTGALLALAAIAGPLAIYLALSED